MDLHRLRVVEFDTLVSEQKGDNKYIPELEEPVEEDCKTSSNGNKDETNETDSDIKGLGDAKSPAGMSKFCQGDVKNSPGTSKKHIGNTKIPTVPSKNCAGDAQSPRGISSNKYKDGKKKFSGTSIKFLGNRLSRPGTSKQNLGSFLGLSGTSKQCAVDSTSVPGTSKNSSCSIRCKSKSEIFRIPSKYKSRNREHKNNLSVVDITTLFHDSAQTRQRRRPLNFFNRKSRDDQHVGEVHAKNEEVNFVFARDTPSFIKYCKRRADNNGRGKKGKRDTKLPSDIFGFQKNNRYIDPYLYPLSCNLDNFPFKKLRKGFHRKSKQPVQTECVCKHQTVRLLNSSARGEPPPPLYYNVNTHHPHQHKPRRKRHDHNNALQRERVWFKGKDETVGVSPSSLSPLVRCLCDARIGPSKAEVETSSSSGAPEPRGSPRPPDKQGSGEAPPAPLKSARKGMKKRYPQHSTPSPSTAGPKKPLGVAPTKICNKIKKKVVDVSRQHSRLFSGRWANFTATVRLKNPPSGKILLKYVLFGLLIVVWSPCLLAVILAWVILCPLKMTSMIKNNTSKKSIPLINSFLNRFRKKGPESEYQRMCFGNCLPANRSFMTSVASWYARAVGTVVNSFNAMASLLKLKKAPTRPASSFLTCNHPNTRKKYNVFYADNRGWMMKSSRRSNTRLCPSTRVIQNMRCEFKPTFLRKTHTERVCKAHKCPFNGSQCVAKLRSSPAGDTNCQCPAAIGNQQGTTNKVQCTCGNTISKDNHTRKQNSSKFMTDRLENIISKDNRTRKQASSKFMTNGVECVCENIISRDNRTRKQDSSKIKTNGVECTCQNFISKNNRTRKQDSSKNMTNGVECTCENIISRDNRTRKQDSSKIKTNGVECTCQHCISKNNRTRKQDSSKNMTNGVECTCENIISRDNRTRKQDSSKIKTNGVECTCQHCISKNNRTRKQDSSKIMTNGVECTCENIISTDNRTRKQDSSKIKTDGVECTCENIISRDNRTRKQDSPKFMISCRCQQLQQVNIPQMSIQSTSGVIPSSTVQTVHVYPINMYQNGMMNTHFSTNRFNQRKNGTLPFGVNLKYPGGTKYPLITNLETYRSQKFGLAGKTLNMSTKYTPSLIVKGLHEHLAKCWTKHAARNTGKKSLGAHIINGSTEINVKSQTLYSDSRKSNGFRGHTTTCELELKCPFGKNRKPFITDKKKHAVQDKSCIHNKRDITNKSALLIQADTNQNTSKHSQTKNINKTQPDIAMKCPYGAKPASPKHTTLNSNKILIPIKNQTIQFEKKANPNTCEKHTTFELGKIIEPYKIQTGPLEVKVTPKRHIALNCPCGAKNHSPIKVYTEEKDKVIRPAQKQWEPEKAASSIKFKINSELDIALNCPCDAAKDKIIHQYQKQPSTIDISTSTKRDIALNFPSAKKPVTANKETLFIQEKPTTSEKETIYMPLKKQDVAIQKQAVTKESASQYVSENPAVRDKSKEKIGLNQETTQKKVVDSACGSGELITKPVSEHASKHQESQCPQCPPTRSASQWIQTKQHSLQKKLDCSCGPEKLVSNTIIEHPSERSASQCVWKACPRIVKTDKSLPNKKVVDGGYEELITKPEADQPLKNQASLFAGTTEASKSNEIVRSNKTLPNKKALDCACGSGKLLDKPVADQHSKQQESQCPCACGTCRQTVQTKQLSPQMKVVDYACGSEELINKPMAEFPLRHPASQRTLKSKNKKSREIIQTKQSLSRGSDNLSTKPGIKLKLMKKSITNPEVNHQASQSEKSNTFRTPKTGSEPLHIQQTSKCCYTNSIAKYEKILPIKLGASTQTTSCSCSLEKSKNFTCSCSTAKSSKFESKVGHQNQSVPKVMGECSCWPRKSKLKLKGKMLSNTSKIEKQKSSFKNLTTQKRSSLALKCPCVKHTQKKQIERFKASLVQYPAEQKIGNLQTLPDSHNAAVDSDMQTENKFGWESLYTNLTLIAKKTSQAKSRKPQIPSDKTAKPCDHPTTMSNDNHANKGYLSDESSIRTSVKKSLKTNQTSIIVKSQCDCRRTHQLNVRTIDETNTSGEPSEHLSRQQAGKLPFGVVVDSPCGLSHQQVTTDKDLKQIVFDIRSAQTFKTFVSSRLDEQSPSLQQANKPLPTKVIENPPCDCQKPKPPQVIKPLPTKVIEPLPTKVIENAPCGCQKPKPPQVIKPLPTKVIEKPPCGCQETKPPSTTVKKTEKSGKVTDHPCHQELNVPLLAKLIGMQPCDCIKTSSTTADETEISGKMSEHPCNLEIDIPLLRKLIGMKSCICTKTQLSSTTSDETEISGKISDHPCNKELDIPLLRKIIGMKSCICTKTQLSNTTAKETKVIEKTPCGCQKTEPPSTTAKETEISGKISEHPARQQEIKPLPTKVIENPPCGCQKTVPPSTTAKGTEISGKISEHPSRQQVIKPLLTNFIEKEHCECPKTEPSSTTAEEIEISGKIYDQPTRQQVNKPLPTEIIGKTHNYTKTVQLSANETDISHKDELDRQVSSHRQNSSPLGIAADCSCGSTHEKGFKQIAVDKPTASTHKTLPLKEPSMSSKLISRQQEIKAVTTKGKSHKDELVRQVSSHRLNNSPLGIAADCSCGLTHEQATTGIDLKQNAVDKRSLHTHKTIGKKEISTEEKSQIYGPVKAEHHHSPKLIQKLSFITKRSDTLGVIPDQQSTRNADQSKMVQSPLLGIASDCVCVTKDPNSPVNLGAQASNQSNNTYQMQSQKFTSDLNIYNSITLLGESIPSQREKFPQNSHPKNTGMQKQIGQINTKISQIKCKISQIPAKIYINHQTSALKGNGTGSVNKILNKEVQTPQNLTSIKLNSEDETCFNAIINNANANNKKPSSGQHFCACLEKGTQSSYLAFDQQTNMKSGQLHPRRYANKNEMVENKSQLAKSSRQAREFDKLGIYPTQDMLMHTECRCSVSEQSKQFESSYHKNQYIKGPCSCLHKTPFSKNTIANSFPQINMVQSSLGSCDKSKYNCSGDQPSSRLVSSIVSRNSSKVRELVKKLRSKLNQVSRRISQKKPKPRNEPNSIKHSRNVGDSSSKLNYKHVDTFNHQNISQIDDQTLVTSAYSNFSTHLRHKCRCRLSRTSFSKPETLSRRSQNSQTSRYPSLAIHSSHSISRSICFCRTNKTSSSKHSSSQNTRYLPLLVHKSHSNSTRSKLSKMSQLSSYPSYLNDCCCNTDIKTSKKSKSRQLEPISHKNIKHRKTTDHSSYSRQEETISTSKERNFRRGMSQFPLSRLVTQQLSSTHKSHHRLKQHSVPTQYPSVKQIERPPISQQIATKPAKIKYVKSLNQNVLKYNQNLKYISRPPHPPDATHSIVTFGPGMCRCAAKQRAKDFLRRTELYNNNFKNELNDQSQLQTQNNRTYRNTMTHISSIFSRSSKRPPQDNQKSTLTQCPSLKNYRSSSAANQTVFSQYSLRMQNKHKSSVHEDPPSKTLSYFAQTTPIIPGKCTCLSEKLHKLPDKLSHHKSEVEKKLSSKPLSQLITSQPTHEDGGFSKKESKNEKQKASTETSKQIENSELIPMTNISSHPVGNLPDPLITRSTPTGIVKPSKLKEPSQEMPKKSRNLNSQITHLKENQQSSRDPVLAPPITTTIDSERPSKLSKKIDAGSNNIKPKALHSPKASHVIIPGSCKCTKSEHLKKTEIEKLKNKPQPIASETKLEPNLENSIYSDFQPSPSVEGQYLKDTMSRTSRRVTAETQKLGFSQETASLHPKKSMFERSLEKGQVYDHLSSQIPEKLKSNQPDISQGTPLQALQPTHIIPGKCSCLTEKHGNSQTVVPLPHPEHFQKSNLVSGICTDSSNRPRYSTLNAPYYSYDNIDLITKRLRRRQRIIIQRSEIQNPPVQPNLKNLPVPSDPQSQQNPLEPQNPQKRKVYKTTPKPNKLEIPNKPQKPKKQMENSLQDLIQNPKASKFWGVLQRNSGECPPGEQSQVYPVKISQEQRNAPADKPPPELLQFNASKHGRNAGDGVQQQYPDFNRVVMRYPGQKSGPNRSERIAPANNYQPAPGVSQPLNYARLPCYVNPANKCGPKFCNDEDALRRAYKRRPLRYAPPKQQVPNIAKLQQAKEKKAKKEEKVESVKNIKVANKKKDTVASKKVKGKVATKEKNPSCFKCVRDLVDKAEKEAWPIDVSCRPIWIHALKHRPCFWIYKYLPSIYPAFLSCYKFQRNLCRMFTYCIAICVWCPMILCFYICSGLICKF